MKIIKNAFPLLTVVTMSAINAKWRTVKYSFTIGIIIISIMGCSRQTFIHHSFNPKNIADNDSLVLKSPIEDESYKISGAVYKAIDQRYITNIHGFSKKSELLSEKIRYEEKSFQIVAFDHYQTPNYEQIKRPLTSLNVWKVWTYCINGNHTTGYSRVLPSVLMPQSLEKVEYIPSDSTSYLLVMMPTRDKLPDGKLSFEQVNWEGTIYIHTRKNFKNRTNDRNTLYLLNNQVITPKIFEAIKPVYIRSLNRITDPFEITAFGQRKKIKEIVKVECFTYHELINSKDGRGMKVETLYECPECDVILIDNVIIDEATYNALDKTFFKNINVIDETEEAFAPFEKLFPFKNLGGWKKRITIVTL